MTARPTTIRPSSRIQARPAIARKAGVPTAISADLLAMPRRGASNLMLSLLVLIAAFIVWASFASIQEVTKGTGRVTPASKIQVVQNLEGGIVREVLVSEGSLVKAGDIILRIDPTQAASVLGESKEKILGLKALIARLEAEVEGRLLSFPKEVEDGQPDLVVHQRELFDARRKELDAAVSAMRLQEQQRSQEIKEAQSRIATLRKALEIASEEVAMTRPLLRSGAASRAELLSLEAKLNEARGSLEATTLAVPRLDAAKSEIVRKRTERLEAFRAEALQRLASARVELSALEEISRGSQDKVARASVKAPTDGIVKTVHVTTPGQVVQPGHSLVEIVPINDTLLVEAQVRPQDIAFLHPGQNAVVKLSAYDFSIYGGLSAKLEHIGADSISTEKGETYYLIRVRTEKAQLTHRGHNLPIIPGMVAEVEVITGSKTVMNYMTKPLLRMRHAALTER
ncbi:MAG: HlyD family type I secretion periplasmic adaptor subunit [Hyphomicrobiaceae bacterium]